MSLIVIGTGTEIGKTVTCAVLLERYGEEHNLTYWKPVATGSEKGTDSDVIREQCGETVEVLQEQYLFAPPVSPHLAARMAGVVIHPQQIIDALRTHTNSSADRTLVIEGIGGLLVPLTEDGFLLADLLQEMGFPCLLVSSSALGTINHTLLTLEAVRRRGLLLAGVVMNGAPNPENRDAIRRFGHTQVVSEIESMGSVTKEAVARAAEDFDREGLLKPFLELR